MFILPAQKKKGNNKMEELNEFHVIAFPDLVDLWVIKIEKAMILCAHSTLRSRDQSTKCRTNSENM